MATRRTATPPTRQHCAFTASGVPCVDVCPRTTCTPSRPRLPPVDAATHATSPYFANVSSSTAAQPLSLPLQQEVDASNACCAANVCCLRRALWHACVEGRADVVAFLLDEGAPIDAAAPDTCTPLAMAARGGHAATVRLLLARGARLDVVSRWGNALDTARLWGHDAVVGILWVATFGEPCPVGDPMDDA